MNGQEHTQEELRYKAMEHDVSDVPDIDLHQIGQTAGSGAAGAYQRIEDAVVGGYKRIEDAVVGGYQKIEDDVVGGFGKMTDRLVEKLFTREGESVEEAKKRLADGIAGEEK